jgi:hypothetical protein
MPLTLPFALSSADAHCNWSSGGGSQVTQARSCTLGCSSSVSHSGCPAPRSLHVSCTLGCSSSVSHSGCPAPRSLHGTSAWTRLHTTLSTRDSHTHTHTHTHTHIHILTLACTHTFRSGVKIEQNCTAINTPCTHTLRSSGSGATAINASEEMRHRVMQQHVAAVCEWTQFARAGTSFYMLVCTRCVACSLTLTRSPCAHARATTVTDMRMPHSSTSAVVPMPAMEQQMSLVWTRWSVRTMRVCPMTTHRRTTRSVRVREHA